ncbi:universal stress protein [Chitinophaga arvensicola]|uniref:Nucleotide-binding universal stress protein, UspA family n=1 Tax=Chitinophaga arvensicola TaxID=29529 RepID=A0A1I0S854_9BACT|nr:universal stress protein [Chitinophaga arvensicola]SEW52047.1 Nucleotide-binding universal stress protein, UspA family [Chitinophaga arvensicola]
MKTMLLLTDFSENAFRATEYAAQLVDPLQVSRILLYHAYQSSIIGTDLPVTNAGSDQQLYLDIMENLGLQQDRLSALVKHARIDLMAEDVSLPAHISQLCKAEEVDIIVMGVSGRSGLEKLLLGSTTSMMIAESTVPVLIVPKDTLIGKPIQSLVFTTDLKDHASIPAHQLYEFLDAFPATVQVLNVDKAAGESYTMETKESIASLHRIFEKYNASFDYINNSNTVEGILSYANQHHASMIIVVPRKLGGLASFFHNSISKKLAYDSNIPLLSLPAVKA